MTITKKTRNGVRVSRSRKTLKTKTKTKSKSKSSSQKTNNKLKKTEIPVNETINYKNGIYDINGDYDNPLTNKPYKNIKAHEITNVGIEKLSKTYANLAKSWSSKLVYKIKDKIIDIILKNQVILLTAGTGVGKTILVPRIALHAFNYKSKVLCTIPKKITTRKTSSYVAECMDSNIGEEVGYYYQGANETNKNGIETKLIFTTTGSLLSRMTGNDPLLSDYKCIIVDEAHERSVQTDQLLLLLKKACIVRPDLKIIIMSATISLQLFRDYYPKTQFKFGEIDAGSLLSFPIGEKWIDIPQGQPWQNKAIDLTMTILQNTKLPPGDVIIFVKAGGDATKLCTSLSIAMSELRKKIKIQAQAQAQSHIQAHSKMDIPPEYLINPLCIRLDRSTSKNDADIATDEYKYKTLKDANGYPYTRKIVIATNVAESSITVEGVVYVIDSGYEYTDSYEPNSRVRMLLESTIAQSAVQQRKGRVGRTQPGFCLHLYSEDTYKNFDEYPTPSIEKSDITNDILDLMRLPEASTIKQMRNLLNEFISPPHEKFIINSIRTLEALGAITNITPSGSITPMGFALSKFRAIKAPYARALIASYFYGCARSVCDIVALITIVNGMIETIYDEFRPDKKKTHEWNKTEELKHIRIIKSYSHNTGDYMTLLKTYQIYLKQCDIFNVKSPNAKTKTKTKTKSNASNKQLGGATKRKSHAKASSAVLRQKPIHIVSPNDDVLDDVDVDVDIVDDVDDDVINDIENDDDNDKKNKKNKESPELKKWCRNNYVNSRRLKEAKDLSKRIYETLMKIVRPYNNYNDKKYPDKMSGGFLQRIEQQEAVNKLEPVVKRFDNEDDNILMSLAIGNFVNFAIKSSSNSSDNTYTSCFAKDKTKLCKINKDSFLTSYPKLIMFDELFCGMRGAKFVKINIVNKIPDHIFNQLKLLYGNKINYTI